MKEEADRVPSSHTCTHTDPHTHSLIHSLIHSPISQQGCLDELIPWSLGVLHLTLLYLPLGRLPLERLSSEVVIYGDSGSSNGRRGSGRGGCWGRERYLRCLRCLRCVEVWMRDDALVDERVGVGSTVGGDVCEGL